MGTTATGPLFALSDEEFARAIGPIPSEAELNRLAAGTLGPPPSLAKILERRGDILAVALAHGFGVVRVVGSVARGEESRRSDLDVVVSPSDVGGATDPVGLTVGLEELFGCRVDVVVDEALPADDRERLLAKAIYL
jgi:predicted nucleotidyltransferase